MTTELIEQLKKAKNNKGGLSTVLKRHGSTILLELKQPFAKMDEEKTLALSLNWVALELPKNTEVKIRIRNAINVVYEFIFVRTSYLRVRAIGEFKGGYEVLHHWDRSVVPKLFLITYHLWDPHCHHVPPYSRKTQSTEYHSIKSLENQN